MAKRTIKLKDYLKVVEEYVAVAAITPGMLIELTSAGKVQAHSTDGGAVKPVMFATEDEFQGNTISDEYSAADRVECWIPQRGDNAYALVANGEDISIGDSLLSDGNGYLRAKDASGDSDSSIVAIALEDVDMSGSSGEDPSGRIIVRIV
jgi:hypothetical protein